MKHIILLFPECLTIKSIYRKRLENGKFEVSFHFNEIPERVCFDEESDIDWSKEFKKGDVVTLHSGGGYAMIEKGNNVSKDEVKVYVP